MKNLNGRYMMQDLWNLDFGLRNLECGKQNGRYRMQDLWNLDFGLRNGDLRELVIRG